MKPVLATASLAALLAATLAACYRDEPAPVTTAKPVAAAAIPSPPPPPPAPPAAKDKYAPLMQAVFGDAYRAAEGNALADLPDETDANAVFTAVQTGAASLRLPSGETVLAVAGERADADGKAASAHASSGNLSLYLLRQEGGHWQVLRRHKNIAQLGSFGNIGKLGWITQPGGKVLLTAEHGGTWQGYTIGILSLFDPTADKVTDLARDIPIHSTSDGACGPTTEHCWDIAATWRFEPAATPGAYDDLVLAFAGEDETAKKGAPPPKDEMEGIERDRSEVAGTARYVFEDGKYVLRQGENLVPGI